MPGASASSGNPGSFIFPTAWKIIKTHAILKDVEDIIQFRGHYKDSDELLLPYNKIGYSLFLMGKSWGGARLLDKVLGDRYYAMDDFDKIAVLSVDPCGPGVKKYKPWTVEKEAWNRKNGKGFKLFNFYQTNDKPLYGTSVIAGGKENPLATQKLNSPHMQIVQEVAIKKAIKALCQWLSK